MTEEPAAGAHTILLVEDDGQVRAFVGALLRRDGFNVVEASDGADALSTAEAHQGDIDLLLSDMLLPELSGYDVALKMQPRFPRMKVLFMTGYVEGEIVQRCIRDLNADFLDKPFQPAVLLEHVRAALQHGRNATA